MVTTLLVTFSSSNTFPNFTSLCCSLYTYRSIFKCIMDRIKDNWRRSERMTWMCLKQDWKACVVMKDAYTFYLLPHFYHNHLHILTNSSHPPTQILNKNHLTHWHIFPLSTPIQANNFGAWSSLTLQSSTYFPGRVTSGSQPCPHSLTDRRCSRPTVKTWLAHMHTS